MTPRKPENASALNYLGYMLADRNIRLPEAQQMVSKALELDPENAAYLDSLGWVYYRQGKLEEAETYLLRAIEKYSKDATVHDHLGDVYLKRGKVKEAVAQWQRALQEAETASASDRETMDLAGIQKKLDAAKVRLAKESSAPGAKQRQ
jgi:Flp pilus assembly protein TadD